MIYEIHKFIAIGHTSCHYPDHTFNISCELECKTVAKDCDYCAIKHIGHELMDIEPFKSYRRGHDFKSA